MENSKTKRLAFISFSIYSAFFILGLGLALVMIFWFKNSDAEGFEGLGMALATVILAAAGFLYSALSSVPIILRGFSLKFPSKIALPAICLPFDLIFAGINITLLFGILADENPNAPGIVFFAALLILSAASFCLNITSVISLKREKKTTVENGFS